MPFFEFTIPLPDGYGPVFNYLYGVWLNSFLTSFIFFKLFSFVSDIKIPKYVYLLMTFSLAGIFARSLGGLSLLIIVYSLICYFFFNHKYTYNKILFFLLIGLGYFYYATSLTGPSYVSLVTYYFSAKYSAPLINYGANFLLLINFGIGYFILSKMKALLQQYAKVVISFHPIVSWIVNLFLISFLVLRNIYHTQFLKMNNLQYGLVGLIYGILTYLIIKYITRYFLYQQRSINLKNEMNSLQVYTSHIEEMYDNLRLFRHDYKNLLLSLDDAIKRHDIDQIESIFNRVILPTNTKIDTQNTVLSKLAQVQSLEIKSLLFDKITLALEKGIKVNLEIEKPITPTAKIDTIDMLRIISILFDNAINAAAKAKDGEINFAFFDDKNNQILIIGNTTDEKNVDLQRLTKQSSRILTLASHGLGLRNLRQLLSRYPFIENRFDSNDHYFEQVIIFHLS